MNFTLVSGFIFINLILFGYYHVLKFIRPNTNFEKILLGFLTLFLMFLIPIFLYGFISYLENILFHNKARCGSVGGGFVMFFLLYLFIGVPVVNILFAIKDKST